MGSERLVDLSHVAMGAVVLGVPMSAGYRAVAEVIRGGGDNLVGDQRTDRGPWDLTGDVSAEDPLSVPTVAALTDSFAFAASGRVSGAATLRKFTLAHAVLTGIQLRIPDRQRATVSYNVRNRAAAASALADEIAIAVGTARALATRGRPIRFATGATFTPDGGSAVTLGGLMDFSWSAAGQVAADADTGSVCIDQLDVTGWQISGSLATRDQTIVDGTALTLTEHLATLGRGTLAIPLVLAGQGDETPPTNSTMTVQRVQFTGTSGQHQTGPNFAQNGADFTCEMRSAAAAALTLAQMLTFA